MVTSSLKIALDRQMRRMGLRMQLARIVLQMTEEDMATAAGCSVKLYRKWEMGHGRVMTEQLCNLSSRLKISMDWLMAGEASYLRPHMCGEAPGKVAILPCVGPDRRAFLARLRGNPAPDAEKSRSKSQVQRDLMQDASKTDAARITKAEKRAQNERLRADNRRLQKRLAEVQSEASELAADLRATLARLAAQGMVVPPAS